MLKRMLTVATVVALAGGVAGCADRQEDGVIEEGGGGGEVIRSAPDRDDEGDDEENGQRGRVAPRDD
jgi:hypothetical protein